MDICAGDPQAKERKMEQEYYTVDFGSLTVDKETADKLENDAEFRRRWIQENAYLDQIIKEDK